ncbi:MAG: type II secretion system protein [Candidatus Sumerlaeia bacterium]|nr:type II secretion system protein [Candidatus Sumerlaeia bacterium]
MKLTMPARRAVTLTEVLVVLVIISLLATIAVPTYVQKLQLARVAIARQEQREIVQALNSAAALHGYVVPLRVLDNVPSRGSASPEDDFVDGTVTGSFLIDPFQSVDAQLGNQATISDTGNARVANLVNFWAGPYLQPQRVFNPNSSSNNPGSLTRQELARDYILDPWNRPYLLYSPLGLVGNYTPPSSASGAIDPTTYPIDTDNGVLRTVEGARFDRWAVLSLGPNGYSDGVTSTLAGTTPEDDIFYEFSISIENETAYSRF